MKDSTVIFVGLFLVLGIGVWSFFRSENNKETKTPNEAISETEGDGKNFQKISISELKNILLKKNLQEEVNIIDMRPASLWSDEHIIGSKSLSWEDAQQSFKPSDVEKSQTWVLVASNIPSAESLGALFRANGISDDHIRILDGNYETWKSETGLIIKHADPTSPIDITKIRLASPKEAREKIAEGGTWFLLDVRSPEAFALDHLPGATNISFSNIEIKRTILPSTAHIFVYGKDDRESFAGGVLLFDLGFFDTLTLSAGFDDWKAQGFPTEKNK